MKAKPAYLHVYEDLRRTISTGGFPYGSKLPSKRSLAAKYGLSLVTIEHAIELLNEEGYIETRERAGLFVSYRSESVMNVNEEEETPFEFSAAAVSETFPYGIFARTVRRVLSEYQEDIFVKSPGSGLPQLQKAIASYLHSARGIIVDPSRIIIGSGSEYLYSLIVTLLGRDQLYGIEEPSYEKIQKLYEASGIKVDHLKLGTNGIRSHELSRTEARILHITPYHSWPSGISADISKRREYLAWAKQRGGVIIEDDYDSEFALNGKPADTLFAMDQEGLVIYLSTFSRTIAPSVRAGFMILPENRMDAFKEKAGFYSCTVSTFSQLILYELIRSGDYARQINRMRRRRRGRG